MSKSLLPFNKNNLFQILKKLMGIGDWGLGIGDWAQSPIPNPQSPIPNPQSISIIIYKIINLPKYSFFNLFFLFT